MKSRQHLAERLSKEEALIGLLQSHSNVVLSELAGLCGYDFLFLDCEHGLFSDKELAQTIQVLCSSDIAALVRVDGHDVKAVGRCLDMGADGIIVPDVTSADEAEALVRAMRYPPLGTRGSGAASHRSTRYGMDLADHIKDPRGGALLIVIIESALGVQNAREILSVNGVDGAFVGPADLSASLGSPGDYSTPAYLDSITRIERAAAATGKVLGTGAHPGHPLEALLERGHRLIIAGGDVALIREAMMAQVSKVKSYL